MADTPTHQPPMNPGSQSGALHSDTAPPVQNPKPPSRTPLALGFAFLMGVLAFFVTVQLIHRFNPPHAQALLSIRDRSPNATAFAVPILNASFTGPGDTWNLADQQGKVVLVNFFATWCGPCREEMPTLFALSQKYAGRVVVIALALDHDNDTPGTTRLAALRTFAQEQKPPFPILFPSEQSPLMTTSLPVPQTILFDKHGRRAQRITGKIDPETIEQSINTLLNEP